MIPRFPRRPRPSARASLAALLLPLALAACEPGAVEWEGDFERRPLEGDPTLAMLALDSTGAPEARARDSVVAPFDYAGRSCPASVRFATARDRLGRDVTAAVWWSVRPDSSARLLAAMSANRGATWSPAVPVDTVDRSHRGCDRPAADVTIEPRTGYVHVAYWLEAPEGPGVFFSHSMDEGGMFHAPVPIVYGERPAAVAISAAGDTVAVAYEDPNTSPTMIGLAFSRTQGHLFERKGLRVSRKGTPAERPAVAVGGGRVHVAWLERPTPAAAPSTIVVRHGIIRRIDQPE